MEPNRPVLFVGVDGGGSRCRVRVRDASGALVAVAEGGAANVYLEFDAGLRTIRDSIRSALASLPDVDRVDLRLGLGLAGVSSPDIAAAVARNLADLGPATVRHDGEAACIGAHAGADGGLVVAGTGSAALARVGGQVLALGGRGFILGDDGSGARLGLEAWRHALRAHDGFEPHTALTRALMAEHDGEAFSVVRWGRTARSLDFAACVPTVFAHAHGGDPLALDLIGATARAVAELGAAVVRLGVPRVALVGGLAAPLRPYLPQPFAAILSEPIHDALDGALLMAGCPLPGGP